MMSRQRRNLLPDSSERRVSAPSPASTARNKTSTKRARAGTRIFPTMGIAPVYKW